MRRLTTSNIRAAAAIRALPTFSSWDEADEGLGALRAHFPDNTNRMHVLLKASAVDKLYSTRAGNILWVTDAVVAAMRELADSQAFRSSEIVRAVDSISRHKQLLYPGSDRCASFASKYCHFFVDESIFPIYDSYAVVSAKTLLGRKSSRLTPGHTEYGDFCERLNLVRVRDGLENVGVRDLDRFLWLWGQLLTQNKHKERVINADVYSVFASKDPNVELLVRSLEPDL